ncbi:MAG: hypothetical protein ACKVOS_11825 [Sphingorhabdus sp.]
MDSAAIKAGAEISDKRVKAVIDFGRGIAWDSIILVNVIIVHLTTST